MELSKRANLQGVREVRLAAPDGVPGAHWGLDVSLRDDSDPEFWRYVGQASVVEHSYTVRDAYGEFTETMHEGFVKRTLGNDPLVSFVWMHDMSTVMAQTRGRGLVLGADPHLDVAARISKADPDAQRLAAKDAAGLAGAMSFAFRVTDQKWNEDYTERDIYAVELHGGDVSAIATGHGANPAAAGAMRSLDFDDVLRFLEAADDDQLAQVREASTREPAIDYVSLRHAELVALEAARRLPVLL